MLHQTLSTFPILTTERLILRQLRESDVQEIFLLRSDPVINGYLDRNPSQSLEDALQFIRAIRSNDLLYWAITPKTNDKLMGTAGLFNLSDKRHTCEIGYELLNDHQGQGIMQEAVKSIITFASNVLGIKTMEAFSHPDNQRSTQLLEKLNFQSVTSPDEVHTQVLLFRRSNEETT